MINLTSPQSQNLQTQNGSPPSTIQKNFKFMENSNEKQMDDSQNDFSTPKSKKPPLHNRAIKVTTTQAQLQIPNTNFTSNSNSNLNSRSGVVSQSYDVSQLLKKLNPSNQETNQKQLLLNITQQSQSQFESESNFEDPDSRFRYEVIESQIYLNCTYHSKCQSKSSFYYVNGKKKKKTKKRKIRVRGSNLGYDVSATQQSQYDLYSEYKDQTTSMVDTFRQDSMESGVAQINNMKENQQHQSSPQEIQQEVMMLTRDERNQRRKRKEIRNSRFLDSIDSTVKTVDEINHQQNTNDQQIEIDNKTQRIYYRILQKKQQERLIKLINFKKQEFKADDIISGSDQNQKVKEVIQNVKINNKTPRPPQNLNSQKTEAQIKVPIEVRRGREVSSNQNDENQKQLGPRSQSVLSNFRPQMRQMNIPSENNKENRQDQNLHKSTIGDLKVKLMKDKEQFLQQQLQIAKEAQVLSQTQSTEDSQKEQNRQALQRLKKQLGGEYPIHRLLFKQDFAGLVQNFRAGVLTQDMIDEKDSRGNTPILLAAKLSPQTDEYLKAVNYLFDRGANGKIRDGFGWSLMDEAISQQNTRLLAITFDQLNKRKKERWERSKLTIFRKLKLIPDFYLELHWECQSNWIPFISKLAPNDTYQIWKVGSYLRLDFSLVKFSKLQQKRRRMSILFRDTREIDDDYKNIDIMLVNRDRQIVVNPLEDLDMDEKLAVLTDIINSDPTQNELNIAEQEWKECKNYKGDQVKETINEYQCNKYKVSVKALMQQRKKIQKGFNHTFDEYFQQDQELEEERKLNTKVSKDVKKTVESYLWLSHEFPLKIQSFLTVLKTLSLGGNAGMSKMKDFMKNQNLKDTITSNGFPVKLQIPIQLSIKANVTFNKFRYLENTPEFIKETFSVPSDQFGYQCQNKFAINRKEGMKTLENKKKRLAFANLAT